jgi:hypothetical protein
MCWGEKVMGLLFFSGLSNSMGILMGGGKGGEYVSEDGHCLVFTFFFYLTTGDMEPYEVNEEIKSSFLFYCTKVDATCEKIHNVVLALLYKTKC